MLYMKKLHPGEQKINKSRFQHYLNIRPTWSPNSLGFTSHKNVTAQHYNIKLCPSCQKEVSTCVQGLPEGVQEVHRSREDESIYVTFFYNQAQNQ